jgi:flagellar motor switch protein FliN/FliY
MANSSPTTDATDTPASVVAKQPEFDRLQPSSSAAPGSTLDSLRDVPITITACLGHTVMPIAEILSLGPGSVVELKEAISTPVELTVRGVPFATGEVVVVDDHFAVRIKKLLPPRTGKAES